MPLRNTPVTLCKTERSTSGVPLTTRMSASYPGASRPFVALTPQARAAVIVAERSASVLVMPTSVKSSTPWGSTS